MRNLFLLTTSLLLTAITAPAQSIGLTGNGTETNPYLINDKDDLTTLASAVNNSTAEENAGAFSVTYFRLEANIDMDGVEFTPIGNDFQHTFGGIFDGNGKTLSNLSVSTGENGYAGLFGRVSETGIIKNLTIKDAEITTSGLCAGGVAGDCNGKISGCIVENVRITNTYQLTGGIAGLLKGTAENVTVSGYIEGAENSVGGIAGQNSSTISNAFCSAEVVSNATGYSCSVGGISGVCYLQDALITGCCFTGTVTAENDNLFCGGITGNLYKGRIEKSFNLGTCDGTEGYSVAIGGIAGRTDDGSIKDCYNSGRILLPYGSTTIGGIAGIVHDDESHTVISNCYNIGAIVFDDYFYDPSTQTIELFGTVSENAEISNVYFDKQMSAYNSTSDAGLPTSEMASASELPGFTTGVWVFEEGMYPRLSGLEDSDAAIASAAAIMLAGEETIKSVSKDFALSDRAEWFVENDGELSKEGKGLRIDGFSTILNGEFASDIIVCKKGQYSRHTTINTANIPFEGDGTELSPYLVKTATDLITMAEATNLYGETYAGKYFRMTTDIDFQSATFDGISSDEFGSKPFAGIFDGDGHSIHNMEINKVAFDSDGNIDIWSSFGYGGLFGQLANGGVVRNLTIADDCKFTFHYLSGAVVGYNDGLIENCANHADIEAYSYNTGGITGNNLSNGIVRGCINTGNITASQWAVGGIAGSAEGIIECCMNTGTIESVTRGEDTGYALGGITGSLYAATLTDVVNAGTVKASAETGGITANGDTESSITNAVNYGMVYADDNTAGAIIGTYPEMKSVSNAIYDNSLQTITATADGDAKGAAGVPSANMGQATEGFNAGIWSSAENQYPYLSRFGNIEEATGAANAIILFAEGENSGNINTATRLGNATGLSWSLSGNGCFTIDGSTLTPVSKGEETLTAKCGKYVKEIRINTEKSAGINTAYSSKTAVKKEYFTATGIKAEYPQPGEFYIVSTTYNDGTTATSKIIYQE